ncbi:jupiter microtubule associated homolog 1 [Discoglossus pictus]
MTTTSNFSGLDPDTRNSSRVLRPPGGVSSFSFGMTEEQPLPARRYKMASNIFGVPYESVPAQSAQEKGAPVSTECGNSEDSVAERMCPDGECGDAADYLGEAEAPETDEFEKEESPAAGAPSEPTLTAAGRRNPPGGKSSLVLG